MSFPTKVQMPIASKDRSTFPLTPQHVTTMNFMETNVAYAMELVPNESLDVKHSLFTRLEPLAVPTFGRATIHNRAFFVPFRTVWPAWNDFIDDTPNASSGTINIPSSVPLITNDTFYNFFIRAECSEASTGVADFSYGGDNYRLTPFGRWCHKIFTSLGYKYMMISGYPGAYSCLPLFSFAKVYIDWYFPSQYAQSGDYLYISSKLNTSIFAQNIGIYDDKELSRIMNCLYHISYDADYFTSAWDNPFSPNDGLSSDITLYGLRDDDDQHPSTYIMSSSSSDPSLDVTTNAGSVNFTQYDLDTLKALTDYCKRNQIAGSRALDRYLSRFGVRLASEKLNRCILLQSYSQPIQFGDVTSLASTEGATLGDYAGKGLSYGDGNYQVDSGGEYGMYIVVTTIIPEKHYYQGLNRHVKHLTRLDFHTPEFDSQGTQMISSEELYLPLSKPNGWLDADAKSLPERGYGFTGRYAEYKVAHSLLTGDYSLPSLNAGKDAWTLFRDVSSHFDVDVSSIHHDLDFVLSTDREQYDRIFTYVGNGADKFNVIHDFNFVCHFPGKSLFDTYEFKDEDKADKVAVDVGGTTVN